MYITLHVCINLDTHRSIAKCGPVVGRPEPKAVKEGNHSKPDPL